MTKAIAWPTSTILEGSCQRYNLTAVVEEKTLSLMMISLQLTKVRKVMTKSKRFTGNRCVWHKRPVLPILKPMILSIVNALARASAVAAIGILRTREIS